MINDNCCRWRDDRAKTKRKQPRDEQAKQMPTLDGRSNFLPIANCQFPISNSNGQPEDWLQKPRVAIQIVWVVGFKRPPRHKSQRAVYVDYKAANEECIFKWLASVRVDGRAIIIGYQGQVSVSVSLSVSMSMSVWANLIAW